MFWLILLLVVLLFFAYLLFNPFIIEIDSEKGLFNVRFSIMASANLVLMENTVLFKIKMFGWSKQINLLENKETKNTKTPIKKRKKKSGKRLSLKTIFRIFSTFRIRKFFISIDTCNMQLNGFLYPLFLFVQYKIGKRMEINFMEENIIQLRIENSAARILWAFIKK